MLNNHYKNHFKQISESSKPLSTDTKRKRDIIYLVYKHRKWFEIELRLPCNIFIDLLPFRHLIIVFMLIRFSLSIESVSIFAN